MPHILSLTSPKTTPTVSLISSYQRAMVSKFAFGRESLRGPHLIQVFAGALAGLCFRVDEGL